MVPRLAVVVVTSCLAALPAIAAPCVGPQSLPGVSAAPRSAAAPSNSGQAGGAAPGKAARSSQNCEAIAGGSGPQARGAVERKGNALKFGDTEIRINGRVRAEGAYSR